MVRRGLDSLDPDDGDLVVLENVGNLVCPALFDLGETKKVVIISVTEGDDKPLKYPHMFAAADLVVVNKTDLLPYVDFDVDRCEKDARSLNPDLVWMPMSVRLATISMPGTAGWASSDVTRATFSGLTPSHDRVSRMKRRSCVDREVGPSQRKQGPDPARKRGQACPLPRRSKPKKL